MQRPSSRARTRSTSSLEGAYHPPTDTAPDAFDYCNAFWVDPHKSREGGRRAEGDAEEKDWGKEGYETVMGRVKASAKVCDDLRALLKERCVCSCHFQALPRHCVRQGELASADAGGEGKSSLALQSTILRVCAVLRACSICERRDWSICGRRVEFNRRVVEASSPLAGRACATRGLETQQ